MRLIASYQMGWQDADGQPTDSGGKAIRPGLAVLSAQACGAAPGVGVPGAVAVELVHNFSLLHDDVMDRDVERRHRPTGWVVFGEAQVILAGNAMLTEAVRVLERDGAAGRRALPLLLDSTQLLISGQSQDLDLEGRWDVTLEDVLCMEAGKTAALLACSSAIGARAAGAPEAMVAGLSAYGQELGIAFQLVDDILGVVGDPATTGKSSSSDVRAGKRSAPIVAALRSGTPAGDRLAAMFADGPPDTDSDVQTATELVREAGGLDWAMTEADARLARAMTGLERLGLPNASAVADLVAVGRFIVGRDR
ncbi:MAG: polyprenyl synthetase family protein [Actinobacteria bacterium]|nr:polyprenyl synthetase family protein [Actinomycetota bacterium]